MADEGYTQVGGELGVALGYSGSRPTYAEIHMAAIAHNLRMLRNRVGKNTHVYAVIKADAYGHGLVPVAWCMERDGVDGLCVALAEEGFRLRAAGVRLPILVLNGAYGHSHREVLHAGLTPVVHHFDQAQAFAEAARPGEVVELHLKVDTGMGRLGVLHNELVDFLERLRGHTNLRVAGVLTHFASADTDPEFTALQCQRFTEALTVIRAAGYRPKVLHAENSAGVYAGVPASYDIARVGIALFGVPPMAGVGGDLRPAMRVVSQVLALRTLQAGEPVGYGGSYRCPDTRQIATVPIGYGDGYLRAAGNQGSMLVHGQRCPIVGRISMDLTTVDVTEVPRVHVGDEVVVLGRQGEAELTADDLAEAAGTLAYEVLCNLSNRVPRVHLWSPGDGRYYGRPAARV